MGSGVLQFFTDVFDVPGFIASIKNQDGVLDFPVISGQAYDCIKDYWKTPRHAKYAYHMNLISFQIARNFIASPEFKTQYGENQKII